MKIGLIGAGRIGKLHGELLAKNIPEAEIKAVAEIYADNNVEKWAFFYSMRGRNSVAPDTLQAAAVKSTNATMWDLTKERKKLKWGLLFSDLLSCFEI